MATASDHRGRPLAGPHLNERHARLIGLMMRQGNVSASEAQSAIAAHKSGDQYGGGEAVQHYGGPTKLIQESIARRNWG